MSFKPVSANATKLWEHKGLKQVAANSKGTFFFRFDSMDCCKKILAGGQWYLAGKPVSLRLWEQEAPKSSNSPTTMSIWSSFFNVPFEYWSATGLSYMSSAVGKPLFVDENTKNRSRVDYVRMCVEISPVSPLPASFQVNLGDRMENVRVQYPWIPHKCAKCLLFGYSSEECCAGHMESEPPLNFPPDLNSWQLVTRRAIKMLPVTQPQVNVANTNNVPISSNQTALTPLPNPIRLLVNDHSLSTATNMKAINFVIDLSPSNLKTSRKKLVTSPTTAVVSNQFEFPQRTISTLIIITQWIWHLLQRGKPSPVAMIQPFLLQWKGC
ncbi:uncharacterized protein LOC132301449 [Cornus florida]|uniref:uncharacterized protein LOC132301449 n=1 Tax=Cornus florida TaxID=4283 RepID=UPI002896A162|nr:uncharacterized protein LOC132301449 [Cornus florida]